MASVQQMELERIGADVSLHGRRAATGIPAVPSLTPLESYTFDVSGFLVCRSVFTPNELAAVAAAATANDGLAALADHETVIGYVEQLCGDAHLPGPPTAPVLDIAPYRLPADGPTSSPTSSSSAKLELSGYPAGTAYSRAYTSLPREGSRVQQLRWSCLGVRVFFALGGDGGDTPSELVLLPGSHRSHFPPPTAVLAGEDEELLLRVSLRAGDIVCAAASTLYRARSLSGEMALAEWITGGRAHPGVGSQGGAIHSNHQASSMAPAEAELPRWVAELSSVERQLVGWGDPKAGTITDGQKNWLSSSTLEAAAPPSPLSLLHPDPASLGVDSRELYFWDVRGYLVLRNAMDPEWLADADAANIDLALDEAATRSAEPVLNGDDVEIPGYERALWRDLSPELQASASTLGWNNATSWELAERTTTCERTWEQLSVSQRDAASALGFDSDSWAQKAYLDNLTYGSLSMRRLGSSLAGTYGVTSTNLGDLLELPWDDRKRKRRHPFRRMVSFPPLLARIQWMQGGQGGYQLINQPRAILTGRGSPAHLLHGMVSTYIIRT